MVFMNVCTFMQMQAFTHRKETEVQGCFETSLYHHYHHHLAADIEEKVSNWGGRKFMGQLRLLNGTHRG